MPVLSNRLERISELYANFVEQNGRIAYDVFSVKLAESKDQFAAMEKTLHSEISYRIHKLATLMATVRIRAFNERSARFVNY